MVISRNKTTWRSMKKLFIVSYYPTLSTILKQSRLIIWNAFVFPTHIYRIYTNKNKHLLHAVVYSHVVI